MEHYLQKLFKRSGPFHEEDPRGRTCGKTKHFLSRGLCVVVILLAGHISLAQSTVTGQVIASDGEVLPGATILLQGTANGAITDIDGNYEISVPNPDKAVLVFSYIGFISQELSVGGRTTIDVLMEADLSSLEEVVVIGYGTQSRGEVTTAIATVMSEDFNPGFVRDAADLIKGKVAGLNISNGSGDPSATSFISLRGISSLQGNAQPLVLINGLPGNMNSVSPQEIETIDVLKDASAAAIYGTRGANGVILITTKSGERDMPPTLSYSVNTSRSSFGRTADFVDAATARTLIDQGETLPFGDDLGYETDWLGEISRNATAQNHNLNFSGGSEHSTYSLSLNYTDQEGVFKKSYNEELRMSADISHYMFDNKLKLNANVINGSQKTGALGDGAAFNNRIYRQALVRNPTDRVIDDEGNFVQDISKLQYVNPVGMVEMTDGIIQRDWSRLTGNVTFIPIDGLENNLMVATERNNRFSGYYQMKDFLGYDGERFNGFASRGEEKNTTNLVEYTSKYTRNVGKHEFSILGGYTHQYVVTEGFWANNRDFPTDAFSYHNLGAGQGQLDGSARMDSYKYDNTLIGFFGRVSYSFDSKYNLLASLRREGSSKFGEANKWGSFPSISAGWAISNEPFMTGVSVVNNLKLRAGYGETGVLPNASYLSQTLLGYSGRFYSDGRWVQGLEALNNPNPDLQWEVSREVNVGLDFSLMDSRISGSIDIYQKKTEGMLWNYRVPTPPNLASNTLANVGEMENKGFELLLNATPLQKGDFTWETSFTLSHNQNKLLSLSNDLYEIDGDYINLFTLSEPVSQVTHRLEVGQAVGNFWGLKSVDVDLVASRENFGEGYFWMIELPDGSVVPWSNELNASDDNKQYLGNGVPDYIMGITNTFRYRNFDLSFLLSGAFGFQIINAQRVFYEYPHIQYNVLKSAFDPVYGKDVTLSNEIGQTFVSYYVEDGDYVKLDNITLGYNFNASNWSFIQSLRLYATGNNLAIFTDYSGIDPEIRRSGNIVNGINSVLTQGTDDRDKYPTVRTFTVGLDITF